MLTKNEIIESPQIGKQWLEIDWDTGEVVDLEPYLVRLFGRLAELEAEVARYRRVDSPIGRPVQWDRGAVFGVGQMPDWEKIL